MNEPVATVTDLVVALGGRRTVAKLCNVGYSAVSNWCGWNKLPDRVRFTLYREAERRGLTVAPQVFGEAA